MKAYGLGLGLAEIVFVLEVLEEEGETLSQTWKGGRLILESGAYQRGRMVKTFLGFLFNF